MQKESKFAPRILMRRGMMCTAIVSAMLDGSLIRRRAVCSTLASNPRSFKHHTCQFQVDRVSAGYFVTEGVNMRSTPTLSLHIHVTRHTSHVTQHTAHSRSRSSILHLASRLHAACVPSRAQSPAHTTSMYIVSRQGAHLR